MSEADSTRAPKPRKSQSNYEIWDEWDETLSLEDRQKARTIILSYCCNDIPKKIFAEAMKLAEKSIAKK